ncbi:hypothetical protein FCV25MIE_33626 [Fagus crenata]
MGGTRHLFIESKAFELTIDHGGGAHIVRLYERGKDTLRSIFMGMKSAKTLLEALEELVFLKHTGDFVRAIREGETVFIAERYNNAKGRFVTIQAIHRGGKTRIDYHSRGSKQQWMEGVCSGTETNPFCRVTAESITPI